MVAQVVQRLGRFEMGDSRHPRGWLDTPSNLLQSIRSPSPEAGWVHTDGVKFYRFVRRHLRYSSRRARRNTVLTPRIKRASLKPRANIYAAVYQGACS